jgi:sugar lactone lactonase YvrE
MGTARRSTPAVVVAGLLAAGACSAAASGPQVGLVRGPGSPEAGRTVSIVVRATASARATVRVWIARGPARRSFAARALSHWRYRARVVFPRAGRWAFGARVGKRRIRFGSVRVRARPVPLTFTWPTSVDAEPDGSLLLVENGNGRVLRIAPATGRTAVVATAAKAYSVAHAPSGAVYLSAASSLLRLDGAGGTTPVTQAAGDIGPVAVAANGDVYFATATQVFRVAGGAGAPTEVAGGLSAPHGLALTGDGGLLVSDTGHRRIDRIDLRTGATETWGDISDPRGIDVAPDRTVYVVDASTHRVVHLMIDGRRLGSVTHVFDDPYDVAAAADGSLYVVDTSKSGRLYRVAPSGRTSIVSRSEALRSTRSGEPQVVRTDLFSDLRVTQGRPEGGNA